MFSPRQLLIAFSLLLVANVSAQQLTYVPEELRPWQDWVLADFEYRDCPFYFDRAASSEADFVCTWPGPLELNVATASATFTQRWVVSGDSRWIPLPGDETYWPERVTVAPGDPFPTRAHWLRIAPTAPDARVSGRVDRAAS